MFPGERGTATGQPGCEGKPREMLRVGGRRQRTVPARMAAGSNRPDDSTVHSSAGNAAPAGRRHRVAVCSARTTLVLAVCLAGAGWAPRGVQAQTGYDKEEIETGIWKGQFVSALCSPPVSAAWARQQA